MRERVLVYICIWHNCRIEEVRSEGNGKCIWHNCRIEEVRERVHIQCICI